MTLILKALEFAKLKHTGQVRRGTGAAYITHPIAVSYLVGTYKKSKQIDELLVASLLHDTIEDTDATFDEIAREFTPLVASLVLELTNDNEQIAKVGKLEYQKKKLLGISNYGLVIKLADRLNNVCDQPTKKMLSQTIELMTFILENRQLSLSHQKMVFDIQSVCTLKLASIKKMEHKHEYVQNFQS